MFVNKLNLFKNLFSIYPVYIRTSLIGGSVLLLIYLIQTISGVFMLLFYSTIFDTGLPGVIFLWWETYYGSFLVRIHSEFGNLLFFMLYTHIIIKIWNSSFQAEIDHTWLSGTVIFIFTYIAGVTGAIMPCSILAEVTATVIGYAINSLSFINFDFLSTPIIPGLGLTDETMFRVFIIHALFPIFSLIVVIDHLNNLHQTEYTDEDEMELFFFLKFEYWDDFLWLELGYWNESLLLLIISRFTADIFWPVYMTVIYSLSNFEFWPILENIDFVLAIPHWYLRPLMSSLVVIPHHYLGFFYIIIFFFIIIMLPFWEDTEKISKTETNSDFLNIKLGNDLNITVAYFFILFFLLITYTTLIIPTGRYFVSLGSNEILVFTFWYLILFLFLMIRFCLTLLNNFLNTSN